MGAMADVLVRDTQEPGASEPGAAPTAHVPARPLGPALLALALGGFTIGTSEFVAMGLLPEVSRGIGVSVSTGGHVVSAYALGVVVGAPLLAAIGARFPRRALLVALMSTYLLGNLLSALAPGYGTLVAARFLGGLPHGAFFGVAALVAADLAGPGRRGFAVTRVMLGLAVANVVGVPAATALGQAAGWRAAFVAAAVLSGLTIAGVLRFTPRTPANPGATVRRELTALRRPQVLLALGTGAIGGGGLFAVYSYISPILTERAGLALGLVPVALAVWGLGMVCGNLIAGKVIDRGPVRAIFLMFTTMAAFFALFIVTSTSPVLAFVSIFLIGTSLAMPTALQTRLMDVAGDAQTLGAALNHASFNLANAIGAALGGAVLAAGFGYAAPMVVAVALTLAGMAIFTVSVVLERRTDAAPTPG